MEKKRQRDKTTKTKRQNNRDKETKRQRGSAYQLAQRIAVSPCQCRGLRRNKGEDRLLVMKLCIPPSVSLSLSLSLFSCLFLSLSVSLCLCLSVPVSFSLSVSLSLSLSVAVCVSVSICVSFLSFIILGCIWSSCWGVCGGDLFGFHWLATVRW